MIKGLIVILLSLFCSHEVLFGYQPLEPDGLIGVLTARTPMYLQKAAQMRRERRKDGSVSRVFRINGRQEFERAVIASSAKRPVVLLVTSSASDDETKMHAIYQDVADHFKKISFVSMDVLAQRAGSPENSELMTQLMLSQNLTQLKLPLMLFFKNGDLYAPSQESAVILQGLYSKEYLVGFIHSKFFNAQQPIINAHAQDLTTTPLQRDSTPTPRKNTNGHDTQEKPSLKQKILHFFKGK